MYDLVHLALSGGLDHELLQLLLQLADALSFTVLLIVQFIDSTVVALSENYSHGVKIMSLIR